MRLRAPVCVFVMCLIAFSALASRSACFKLDVSCLLLCGHWSAVRFSVCLCLSYCESSVFGFVLV